MCPPPHHCPTLGPWLFVTGPPARLPTVQDLASVQGHVLASASSPVPPCPSHLFCSTYLQAPFHFLNIPYSFLTLLPFLRQFLCLECPFCLLHLAGLLWRRVRLHLIRKPVLAEPAGLGASVPAPTAPCVLLCNTYPNQISHECLPFKARMPCSLSERGQHSAHP